MRKRTAFILTEAAATLPLVRQILIDIREARARLSRLDRQIQNKQTRSAARLRLRNQKSQWRARLDDCLGEARRLGIEVTPGIRCEAHFPFDHQWTGPAGDGKIRPAFFVYNDAQATIDEWFFAGWPGDRRKICPKWWKLYRQPAKATVR